VLYASAGMYISLPVMLQMSTTINDFFQVLLGVDFLVENVRRTKPGGGFVMALPDELW